MELREYVALFRKWLWLLVLCTVLAGVVAFVVSKNTTPIYQASSLLRINQASNPATSVAYADILTAERLARTYANLLTTRPVLEESARRLGIDVESLKESITVTPVRDALLLEVKVEGPNPKLIADVANVLPQVFIDRDRELQLGQVSRWRESLEAEIEATLADISRTQEDLKSATDDTQKTRLEGSLAQYRTTYSSLLASAQQARTAEAQATNNLVVAEPAIETKEPIRPRTLTNTLLAAVIGAMLAIGVAFLIEYLDDTVKTPDDVERVSGLSTLGAIARLKDGGGSRQIVAWSRTRVPESEAYRTLRTNIQFSSVDKPIKALMVTSSSPSEGKSTTAATLALHRAIYYPDSLILLVSPSLRQSAELFRKVAGLLNRPAERPALVEDNRLSCSLANRSRVISLPSSEATIRGFSGAALIIEDEASRVSDDLYRAVRPMLATSGGRLILMSTPYGKRGHFWDVWSDAAGGSDWERVRVPASACPRISAAFLDEERTSLGAWWYAQEYECEFVDAATSAFTWEMIRAAQKEAIQTWDL